MCLDTAIVAGTVTKAVLSNLSGVYMSVDTFCEADAVMKKCVVQINMKTQ